MKNVERLFIRGEITQRQEEGCDLGDLETRVEAALKADDKEEMVRLYNELDTLEPADSFGYDEPSTLEEIKALRPEGDVERAARRGLAVPE